MHSFLCAVLFFTTGLLAKNPIYTFYRDKTEMAGPIQQNKNYQQNLSLMIKDSARMGKRGTKTKKTKAVIRTNKKMGLMRKSVRVGRKKARSTTKWCRRSEWYSKSNKRSRSSVNKIIRYKNKNPRTHKLNLRSRKRRQRNKEVCKPGRRGGRSLELQTRHQDVVWSGQCVRDSEARLLPHCREEGRCGGGGSVLEENSPARCVEECRALGYLLAGVQASDHCLCGDRSPPSTAILDSRECATSCPGDRAQACGGRWKMNVWATGGHS